MRVALVRQRYQSGGGAERSVANLADELKKNGHEVHLFAHRWTKGGPPGIVFHRVPVIPGASFLKVLSFAFFSAHLIMRNGFFGAIRLTLGGGLWTRSIFSTIPSWPWGVGSSRHVVPGGVPLQEVRGWAYLR